MYVCDMKAQEKPGEASSMRQRKDEAACPGRSAREPNIKTRSFEKWYFMSSKGPISIKMTKLVKIPPSQGQTLALLRMIMALPQTNNFKANTQILANVDPVQKLGLFGNAEE